MAEITIVAADAGGTVSDGPERVDLRPGEALAIDRTRRTTTRTRVFVPKRLKPPAQIARLHEESAPVARLSDEELARFGHGEPLMLELHGAQHLDLTQVDEVAGQADERGVGMTVILREHRR